VKSGREDARKSINWRNGNNQSFTREKGRAVRMRGGPPPHSSATGPFEILGFWEKGDYEIT